MTEFSIRPAIPDDAREIANVQVQSFLATYGHLPITSRSAEEGMEGRVAVWLERLTEPGPGASTLVAADNRQIWGFVHLGRSPDPDDPPDTGHIFSMHVSPERTGMRIGGRLMEAAVRTLTETGCRASNLWVVKENDGARRFYERLGWRSNGGRRREKLAVGDEEGNEVDVVRYRLDRLADQGTGL